MEADIRSGPAWTIDVGAVAPPAPLRYYVPTHARRWIRGMYVLYGASLPLIFVGSTHDGATGLGVQEWVFGAIFAAMIVFAERVTVHMGLEECADHLVDHGNFYARRIPYADIVAFEARPAPSLGQRLCVRRRDGTLTAIQCVYQARPVSWEGGETRDIVSVLNARLLTHAATMRR